MNGLGKRAIGRSRLTRGQSSLRWKGYLGEGVVKYHACVQWLVMHGRACIDCGRRYCSGKLQYEVRNQRRTEFGERVVRNPEGR